MIELGLIVQEARHRSGLTLRELSKFSGLAYSTLASYESGSRIPSATSFKKILPVLPIDGRWVDDVTWISGLGDRYSLSFSQGCHRRYPLIEGPPEPDRVLVGAYLRPSDADRFSAISERMDVPRWHLVTIALLSWLDEQELSEFQESGKA